MPAHRESLDQQWREHVDRILLNPARLFVMALLVSPDHYRFGYLCECSGVTKPVMARHVRRLRDAGYVETRRGAYQESWVRITALGHQRFDGHMKAINETVTRAREHGRSVRS
ncbi:MAG: MarR family transcriptional regulator [Actinophytocola sp.]|nr:MarR family transcriptional regulator [Actinophytocola sp.]